MRRLWNILFIGILVGGLRAILGDNGRWDMIVVEGYPGDELTWTAYVAEDDGCGGECNAPLNEVRAFGKTRNDALWNLFSKLLANKKGVKR